MKWFSILLFISLILAIGRCNQESGITPVTPVAPIPGQKIFATGLKKDGKPKYGVMHFIPRHRVTAAENFSWEDQGFATPIRDQGSCGSCWAFGGTQTLEMGYKIFTHQDIDFSEQDLVGQLFDGCGGGYFTGDFQVAKGQLAEKDCTYSASDRKCKRVPPPVAGQGISQGMVGQNNRKPTEQELQDAIQSYGAISVTVGANNAFMNYSGGFEKSCPSVGTNHIVALTGWKTNPADGKVYFKIKNSWGESWGEKGYGYFKKDCFSLAEEAAWLAVQNVPCPPPAVKLPAEIVLNYGDDVELTVKNVPGVVYAWYQDKTKLSDSYLLEMVAKESMVLTLTAKNQCGDAEIQTLVTIKNP